MKKIDIDVTHRVYTGSNWSETEKYKKELTEVYGKTSFCKQVA